MRYFSQSKCAQSAHLRPDKVDYAGICVFKIFFLTNKSFLNNFGQEGYFLCVFVVKSGKCIKLRDEKRKGSVFLRNVSKIRGI